MKQIPLTQGQVATVDDEDYEWLTRFKWHALWNPCTKSFYAVRAVPPGLECPREKRLLMHRVVWERHHGPIADRFTVDHADHDTLDNRLAELRLATRSQQSQNRRLFKNNTSGYRGVHMQRSGNWQAVINVDGKRICLGTYADPADAARAYDDAARSHHGEFARLNFPERELAMVLGG